MMLNPRKRPKSPPREAMKSTGPILMFLSNSGEIMFMSDGKHASFTHDCVLAEKYVDNSNVLLPGVVVFLL